MQLHETKAKLEFDKILDRIKHHSYSDLGILKCDEIDFITDFKILNAELDKVSEMKEILITEGELPLDGLKDIRNSLNKIKIEGHFISPEEFLHILNFLRISRMFHKYIFDINKNFPGKYTGTYELIKNLFFDKILEHNIDITIDESGQVKDNASSGLKRIRKQINLQSGRLRKTLAEILRKVSEKEYAQEDIVTQRDGRFVIPVKAENKRNVPGIIHSSSSTGATVFIEPTEIISLNNDITELFFEEKREIENILRELAKQLKAHVEELRINSDILAEADFIQAKARYAIESVSVKPELNDKILELRNAFHPVLIKSHKKQEVVPLNLKIGEEFNTLVISGPNAGGKTVVLKTVGLNQMLLQSGILVPVNPDSKFRLFKKLFISIGDEQSIENDLSTFSSHLKSIKEIMEHADDDTLILIDEIASGTDPVLGSALSASILKYLSDKNAITIVTTHNSELKEFAFESDGIENGSLEFDVETLSPNFNFITGIPGQSFTFEIAKKFNFPEQVLNDAYSRLDTNESRLEELLKNLNETKQRYKNLKDKFDIDNARLKGLTGVYEQKVKEITKNEKELKYKAKLEAEKIIKDANKLIEKTIKEIREEKHSPKEIKSEFKKESEAITKIDIPENEQPDTAEEIKVNDTVKFRESSATGTVVDVKHDMVSVIINGIVIKTNLNEIEKVTSGSEEKIFSGVSSFEINREPVNFNLDIRGKYTDEIPDMIEKFVNDAVINGLKEICIIHGKGSGKLREKVHSILKNTPSVKSFRLGNWDEGNTGVTIVEI